MRDFSLCLLILSLTPICLASSSESKKKPDRHRCPADQQAYGKVWNLQEKYEWYLKYYKQREIEQLTWSDFTFSILDKDYQNPGNEVCCIQTGDLDGFLQRYLDLAGDRSEQAGWHQITFLIPGEPYMLHQTNGTIAVERIMLDMKRSEPQTVKAYKLRFHWSPDDSCNYDLVYIEGNNMQCPSFLPDAQICRGLPGKMNFQSYQGARDIIIAWQSAMERCEISSKISNTTQSTPFIVTDKYGSGQMGHCRAEQCCKFEFPSPLKDFQLMCKYQQPVCFGEPRVLDVRQSSAVFESEMRAGAVYTMRYLMDWDCRLGYSFREIVAYLRECPNWHKYQLCL